MPMKVCAKPEPGIETNGELKPVAIAFASIVLAGAGRADEEQAALALAARALERLAPDCHEGDDLRQHLLLRLPWPRTSRELDAPLRGRFRLEAADLRDAHDQHRAHEDREVGDEEEEDEDDLHPEPPASR